MEKLEFKAQTPDYKSGFPPTIHRDSREIVQDCSLERYTIERLGQQERGMYSVKRIIQVLLNT